MTELDIERIRQFHSDVAGLTAKYGVSAIVGLVFYVAEDKHTEMVRLNMYASNVDPTVLNVCKLMDKRTAELLKMSGMIFRTTMTDVVNPNPKNEN